MPSWPDPPTDPAEVEAWLIDRQEELVALMAAEMARITERHVTAYANAITADVGLLDGMEAEWRLFVQGPVADFVGGTYLSGNLSAWLTAPSTPDIDDWLPVVNDLAVSYQTTATNRIVGASADVWQDVRVRTVDALETGMTNVELADEIADVTGYSETRAATIARTETVGAYNAGDLDGARQLGDEGPVAKGWLATNDARTREEHAMADGQVVAIGEPFNVGGEAMMHPADPAGSPGNVVNCRCTMLMFFADDPEAADFLK